MSIDFLLPPNRSISLRRRFFMPWSWPRWSWCGIGLSLVLLYFLSAVPITRCARQKLNSREFNEVADAVYAPVRWCADVMPIVANVMLWEHELMDRWIGPEFSTPNTWWE